RCRLDASDNIRDGMSCLELQENVNVIRNAAHALGHSPLMSRGAAQVGVESVPPFWRDERPPFLGAEYDMSMKVRWVEDIMDPWGVGTTNVLCYPQKTIK